MCAQSLPFFPPPPSPPPLPPPFLPSFPCWAHCYFPSFLHCPVLLFEILIASGVLAHPGSPSIKPAKHGPESASSSQYLREQKTVAREDSVNDGWDSLFQSYLLLFYFVVVYIQRESGVAAETYRGSNGSSSCSVNYWKLLTTKK